VTLHPITKARLRLVAVAVGLIPLALLARACGSKTFMTKVQSAGARAWLRYDKIRER